MWQRYKHWPAAIDIVTGSAQATFASNTRNACTHSAGQPHIRFAARACAKRVISEQYKYTLTRKYCRCYRAYIVFCFSGSVEIM